MKKAKIIVKTRRIPISEESYKEWQKAFTNMKEYFEHLNKQKK